MGPSASTAPRIITMGYCERAARARLLDPTISVSSRPNPLPPTTIRSDSALASTSTGTALPSMISEVMGSSGCSARASATASWISPPAAVDARAAQAGDRIGVDVQLGPHEGMEQMEPAPDLVRVASGPAHGQVRLIGIEDSDGDPGWRGARHALTILGRHENEKEPMSRDIGSE